ncbi:type II toxin-antitoxin system RelE/ParE family toxin [Dyadobacter sp.]|uniref:type II toxin-antitoxin system RelE/ParE family toxin n=1 Tax=Dyadobacter sp. TaxID=1914288 RepID=UPI003F722AE7
MRLQVIFTHTAVETYEAIFDQISSKFGHSAAQKFEAKVFRTLRTLSGNPLIFRETADNPRIRKGFIHENCSFFYNMTESEIYILYFWDNRQEPLLE